MSRGRNSPTTERHPEPRDYTTTRDEWESVPNHYRHEPKETSIANKIDVFNFDDKNTFQNGMYT